MCLGGVRVEGACRDGSTHFWRKFSRRCTSVSTRLEAESVDAKGSPLSPVSLFPVPGPRQAPSPTRELSSFAMHNNLPRIIHIHKWRMHIRDKFPRGVPPHPPVPTLQSVNYFLAKLKAGGSSCV